METPDLYGIALLHYLHHEQPEYLTLHTSYQDTERMPMAVFFREYEENSVLEQHALGLCRGDILDIGAGAGSHALWLQEQGLSITALDSSPLAVEVMKQRGVAQTVVADIFSYSGQRYDTLLLLMNGIGLAGQLSRLDTLLQHFHTLLKPNGQVLFDSSDISYLYPKGKRPKNPYYGEIKYRYAWKGQKGDWFPWLYVDAITLHEIASRNGWEFQVLFEDGQDQYLGRLTATN